MCKTCTTFSARPSLQNDMDGGVAAALIEEEAEQRACPDLDAHWRLDEAMARAERAERERDEWKDSAIKAMADLERAEQPRPLTADDITDEMVKRGNDAWSALRSPENTFPRLIVETILRAALTEPSRPEGAEEIEDLLADWFGENDSPDQSNRDLADYLVRKGVHVTGAES